MAKKKQEPVTEPVVKEKTLEELTDGEFLAGIEKWGAPIYNDYMHAPLISKTTVNGYLSDTHIGILAKNAKVSVEEPKIEVKEAPNTCDKEKRYTKKRTVLLVVVMVLTLAFIAGTALGAVKVEKVSEYFYLYNGKDGGTAVIDPVTALMAHLTHKDGGEFVKYFESAGKGVSAVPVYAVFFAVVLYLICVLIMFVKSLIATFEKRTVCGYYKKRKFGYISIVAFLCALICLVGGVYVSGGAITNILDFFTATENAMSAGYALYAMLGLPVVTLLASSFAYGKKR